MSTTTTQYFWSRSDNLQLRTLMLKEHIPSRKKISNFQEIICVESPPSHWRIDLILTVFFNCVFVTLFCQGKRGLPPHYCRVEVEVQVPSFHTWERRGFSLLLGRDGSSNLPHAQSLLTLQVGSLVTCWQGWKLQLPIRHSLTPHEQRSGTPCYNFVRGKF